MTLVLSTDIEATNHTSQYLVSKDTAFPFTVGPVNSTHFHVAFTTLAWVGTHPNPLTLPRGTSRVVNNRFNGSQRGFPHVSTTGTVHICSIRKAWLTAPFLDHHRPDAVGA